MIAYQDLNQAIQAQNQAHEKVVQALSYLKEVSQGSNFTEQIFYQAMQDVQQSNREANSRTYNNRVFYSIQSFLVAVANISKLFWPGYSKKTSPGSYKQALREALRKSLSIGDDWEKYVFGKSIRDMRDSFEHFDKRIDEKWFNSSQHHNIVDLNIMPLNAISGAEDVNFLRNFDPISFSITFNREKIDLPPLMEAIKDLWKKIDEIEKLERSQWSKLRT